jgi:hypothetical protein
MKTASYVDLPNQADRIVAKVAARARLDTIYGGALALVWVKRLPRLAHKLDLGDVVSDVYSASTGRHSKAYEGWQCPECGQAYLGQEAAALCCQEVEAY